MMTTINITTTNSLDMAKINAILSLHNTSKNAILNKFLLLIQNGNIDVDNFLSDNTTVQSDYDLLTEKINQLELGNLTLTERLSIIEKQLGINSKLVTEDKKIDILESLMSNVKTKNKENRVKIKIINNKKITFDCYPNESMSMQLASELESLGCDVTTPNNFTVEITNFSHLGSTKEIATKISTKLQSLKYDVTVVISITGY